MRSSAGVRGRDGERSLYDFRLAARGDADRAGRVMMHGADFVRRWARPREPRASPGRAKHRPPSLEDAHRRVRARPRRRPGRRSRRVRRTLRVAHLFDALMHGGVPLKAIAAAAGSESEARLSRVGERDSLGASDHDLHHTGRSEFSVPAPSLLGAGRAATVSAPDRSRPPRVNATRARSRGEARGVGRSVNGAATLARRSSSALAREVRDERRDEGRQ